MGDDWLVGDDVLDGGAGGGTIRFAGVSADYHIMRVVGGWQNVEHLQVDDMKIWLLEPNSAPVVLGPVISGGGCRGGAGVLVVDALANASDTLAQRVTNPGALSGGVSFDTVSQNVRVDARDAAFEALAVGEQMLLHIEAGVTDGTTTVEVWVTDDSIERPHSALGYQTTAGGALTLTTAIARPAARDVSSARRAIAKPAPIGVDDHADPVVAG